MKNFYEINQKNEPLKVMNKNIKLPTNLSPPLLDSYYEGNRC